MSTLNSAPLTTETYREYHYASGESYRVEAPVKLWFKSDERGDSHRVLDAAGVTHYPRRGWVAITWLAPEEPVSF